MSSQNLAADLIGQKGVLPAFHLQLREILVIEIPLPSPSRPMLGVVRVSKGTMLAAPSSLVGKVPKVSELDIGQYMQGCAYSQHIACRPNARWCINDNDLRVIPDQDVRQQPREEPAVVINHLFMQSVRRRTHALTRSKNIITDYVDSLYSKQGAPTAHSSPYGSPRLESNSLRLL